MVEQAKTTAEELNGNLHKEQSIHYRSAIKQMIRAFIKKCPREILIDVLKSEKLIKRDWSLKGEKYIKYEK